MFSGAMVGAMSEALLRSAVWRSATAWRWDHLLLKHLKLREQNRCLQGVEPAVHAEDQMVMFFGLVMVANLTHALGKVASLVNTAAPSP